MAQPFLTMEDFFAAMAESREEQRRNNEYLKDMFKEIGDKQKENEKLVKALSQNIDGVNDSLGKDSEMFFYTSLQKKPYLRDIKFDFVDNNLVRTKDGEDLQIDIFLENGKSVGLVEVKNKVTSKAITQIKNQMDRFCDFHPVFKGYKIYGAIAGKVFPKHLQEEALKNGLFVLLQQGNHLEVSVPTF